jgi:hypothetical protein
MEWLRLYVGILDNAKVEGLPGTLFKAWVKCLCLARIHDGGLPSVTDVIAFRLRCTPRQAEQWRDELAARKLIDVMPDGSFRMHDWDQHQYVSDGSTQRVRKHREKQRNAVSGNVPRNVSHDVTVTPSDTDTEQSRSEADSDTDTETSVRRVRVMPKPADMVPNDPPSERFEEAWSKWPLKVEKDAGAQAWLSVVPKSKERAVFACIGRYLASDQVVRGVVAKFAGWLFQASRDNWQSEWPTPKPPRGDPYTYRDAGEKYE